MNVLQLVATALVLYGVWRISVLDVRGQYAMVAAQVAWGAWALIEGHWWLAVQSGVLLVLAVRAVRFWNRRLP